MLLHMTSTQERFWGNRCQGNCGGMRSSRREPVTQVDGCAEVLFTFAPHVCVWMIVYMIITLLRLIMFQVAILLTLSVSPIC